MNSVAAIKRQASSDALWNLLSSLVILVYACLGILAVNVAIGNHAGGLATSIMDSADSLGLSSIWELQANLSESHLYMMLMMWGFNPIASLSSLFFGDTWTALYMDLLFSVFVVVASGWVIFRYSLEVTRDSRITFGLVVLYFLLPVTFANTVYWYGQPVFLMIMAAIYLMRRGYRWPAMAFVVWAHGCHPMAVPAFLGLAWASFKMDLKGQPPILPGLDRRDSGSDRSWRFSLVTCGVLTLWSAVLIIGSKLDDSGTNRGLLWDFFSGKLDSGTIPLNFSQTMFFLLPMLFLPLMSRVWIPALIVFFGYMLFGSQGVVTGFVLPGAAFCMLAMAYVLAKRPERQRRRLTLLAVVSAVLVNLLVPWPALFPMYPEPLTGGVSAPHSWSIQAGESAVNTMIRKQISENTPACLTTWQIGPVMAERCRRVTTLSFPFRREKYTLQDFLDSGDKGRLDSGQWNYILIDLRREAYSPGLENLVERIESSGMWKVADRTAEAVLYRNSGSVD